MTDRRPQPNAWRSIYTEPSNLKRRLNAKGSLERAGEPRVRGRRSPSPQDRDGWLAGGIVDLFASVGSSGSFFVDMPSGFL